MFILKFEAMKRILCLLAALVAFVSVGAQNKYESFVDVTGRAEREVTPDEFYLMIVLQESDTKGKVSVEQQQKDLLAVLKREGVSASEQLKIANLSSAYFKKRNSLSTVKYQLKLGSAAEVGRVWQSLNDAGIPNVSIMKVSHSDLDGIKEEVRKEAILNARTCAETLAGALGQKVGPCFYIWDANSDIVPVVFNNFNADYRMKARGVVSEAAADEDTSVDDLDFKSIKLNYRVQAKFVLLAE